MDRLYGLPNGKKLVSTGTHDVVEVHGPYNWASGSWPAPPFLISYQDHHMLCSSSRDRPSLSYQDHRTLSPALAGLRRAMPSYADDMAQIRQRGCAR